MELSHTEENYLKVLLQLNMDYPNGDVKIGTNKIAFRLNVKASSVNDMLKKLKAKKLINYEKYGNVKLTKEGQRNAIQILRKHRLWETFLYKKLDFTWDEVEEVAEQLEHINSPKLVLKIEKMLDFPNFDPHGQPIPNEKGEINTLNRKILEDVVIGTKCEMVAVKDNSVAFLQYVTQLGLSLQAVIEVRGRQEFDGSMVILIDGKTSRVSAKFAKNIWVICQGCSHSSICVKPTCLITEGKVKSLS